MSDKDSNESILSEELDDSYNEEVCSPLPIKNKRSKSTKKKSIKQRPKSASAVYGRSSQDLWSHAMKNGHIGKKGKRTPTDYWTESLSKTGVGFTGHSLKHNSFSGLKKSERHNMGYNSTSHYMRQTLGLEKTKKSVDGPVRTSGTPTYKSQEEYYDDIISLKKDIASLNMENSMMKSKVRRLEEDNIKKEKEIKHLLDPSKSEEFRRTVGDRKPESGSMIQSLKQKILKLEQQLKEKESSYTKLQSDLKTTKVEEMKIQMETFYKEIMRLSQLKTVEQGPAKPPKENSSKIKALQEMIKTLNMKNVQLRDTNQSLQQDLNRMMEQREEQKNKQKEYDEMSRKQLLNQLSRMEKKLERAETDNSSVLATIDSRHSEKHDKITLEGNVQQRLEQLSNREDELLEEIQKHQVSIKRLQTDRVHYKKKCDDKDKEIKQLKKDIESLQDELQTFYEKDKAAITPRTTPRTRSHKPTPSRPVSSKSRSRSPSVLSDSSERERERLSNKERARKQQNFREQRAAKVIQRSWRNTNERRSDDEATELIQGAFRGHLSRSQRLKGYDTSEYSDTPTETELDEAAELIQSNMRGYLSNKERLRRKSLELHQKRKQSISPKFHEESEEEEDHRSQKSTYSGRSYQKGNVSNRSIDRTSPGPSGRQSIPNSRRSSTRDQYSVHNNMEEEDDDDSDDDIVMTSSRGRLY